MTTRLSKHSVGWLALLAACAIPLSAHATSVSGTVVNSSVWLNTMPPLTPPPGDSSGNGEVIVGVWGGAPGATVIAPPMFSSSLLASGPLPAGAGPFPYFLGGALPDGNYYVIAWIEGNTDATPNPGEPRSAAYVFAIAASNPVWGADVEIVDDLDNDGLPDWWEVHYFGNLAQSANSDYDGDGLLNVDEYNTPGLDPANWDTDGDGMDDKWEFDRRPDLDPTDPTDDIEDADGDGVLNLQEYRGVDGEGIIAQNPAMVAGIGYANPADSGDVLDPLDVDTDEDGLVDSFEVAWYDPGNGISPTSAGNPDADPDQDGLTNFREQCLFLDFREGGALAYVWLSGPTFSAGLDLSWAGSPLLLGATLGTIQADLTAFRNHDWTDPTEMDGYTTTLDYGHDTDGDQLPDGWEVEHNLNPTSGWHFVVFPGFAWNPDGFFGDPDGDGLINYEEYRGQDGDRAGSLPYVNGTGDETNPFEHNSTARDFGVFTGRWIDMFPTFSDLIPPSYRALPFLSMGADDGFDTDDDGTDDYTEINQEYPPGSGMFSANPVCSMSPFKHMAAAITETNGIAVPDPESGAALGYPGYTPFIHTRDWTIECSVKPLGTNLTGTLIHCGGPDFPFFTNRIAFSLGLSNNIPYVAFNNLNPVGGYFRTVGLALPSNQWTHLAGVWNHASNSLSLYVGGIFLQQNTFVQEGLSAYYFDAANPPTIGASPAGGASFTNRLFIDEVRIWTVSRSAGQIEAYRKKLVPHYPPDTTLVAYYRFDDGGNSAEDFAHKAKNGLLGADPLYFYVGDHGYALPTNNFFFTNDAATVLGVWTTGADDSDGDGMPDDWEMIYHLDPFSAASPNGAEDDPDGDGLFNINEFYAQTNPKAEDTDGDGEFDGNEDLDDDGLVNLAEQSLGSRPDIVDTDDDGKTDKEEQMDGTDPANPGDPMVSRAIGFGGLATDYLDVPIAASQRLSSWTIEAWVNPDTNANNSGTILRRTVQAVGSQYAMNYVLGLSNNAALNLLPYAGYVLSNGQTNFVSGSAIPTGAWTHVAATFDQTSSMLRLYTNGILSAAVSNLTSAPPSNGKGGDTFVRIGEDFAGGIDDVRLWSVARSAGDILRLFSTTVGAAETGLMVHYLRFDDGEATNAVKAWSIYHQPHGIQDFLFPTDWEEQWLHAAVRHGNTTILTNGAFIPPPTLRVTIEPADARAAGAQWRLDLGGWNNSGVTLDNLSTGLHTVAYQAISGWLTPSSDTVSLSNGVATSITRTYTATPLGVNGLVTNQSVWVNNAAPGDGTGTGRVVVAMWSSAAGGPIGATPTTFSNLTVLAAMPLPGGSFSYTMGAALPAGSYTVMAWIDGNNNLVPDLGEPRSVSAFVFLSATLPTTLDPLTITDDSDGDGIPDYWEVMWFGDMTQAATSGDQDHDGLTNAEEFDQGLNPMDFDTDGDGMDDKWELDNGLQPGVPDGDDDNDGDGLPNLVEYLGMDDQPMMTQDPTQPPGVGYLNPADSNDILNPMDIDTDSDGLIDSFEAAWYTPGSIEPHMWNDRTADPDGDGMSAFREQCLHTNLMELASNDIWSVSVDGTNMSSSVNNLPSIFVPGLNLGAVNPTMAGCIAALRGHSWTDPMSDDSDDDGLPDGWETEFFLDPRSAVGNDGYFGDPDGDGLVNFSEFLGQDGNRDTGDETNPNYHFWRTLSTKRGDGIGRPVFVSGDYWTLMEEGIPTTLGSSFPGMPLGWDDGADTDDDGINDDVEIQQEYYAGIVGSSPVHSMSPFVRRAALITDTNGIPVPDPEGGIYYAGYRPDFHRRDWTIECYVKPLTNGLQSGSLIRCGEPAGAPFFAGRVSFELGLSNNVPYVRFDTINATNPTYRVTGLAIASNRWTHVAGVWDHANNSLGLYLDGIFVNEQRVYEESLSRYLFDLNDNPVLGAATNGSFANALLIDEVRVWGVARTPTQVEAYRNLLVSPTQADLVAYYRFDDGGLTAEDFTRRAQNSLTNSTPREYLFGDQGFALSSGFAFTNDAAPVLGVSQLGADDSDGDGLPDDWEMINRLDPSSTNRPSGASDDPDGDGLSNLYEFYAQTNPNAEDTDQDGILDGSEDLDQDGVVNLAEQTLGSRPDIVDTDDDGLTDKEEQSAGSSPARPVDPMVSRAIHLSGLASDYLDVPISADQRLSSWTIEAWVNPDTDAGNSGTILRRTVQAVGSEYAVNYVLGLSNNAANALLPYAGYVLPGGETNYVSGNAIPTGTWTHLAAAFDQAGGILRLYTNGALEAEVSDLASAPPKNGKGGDTFVRIGEDFAGGIDEVRLWNVARLQADLVGSQVGNVVQSNEADLIVHDFRFDDGQANTNTTPWGVYHQPAGMQNFKYSADWQNQWIHAARFSSTGQVIQPGAISNAPSLRVTLTPAGLRNAAWRIDGGSWLPSGYLVENLTPGPHTILFDAVENWISPDPNPETVILTNGLQHTLVRTYSQMNGAVISGEVRNYSTWNGATQGQIRVAAWDRGSGWWNYWYYYHWTSYYFYDYVPENTSPTAYSNLTGIVALPTAFGPYSYMLTGLEKDYHMVIAWIDTNDNGRVDWGEPRSYGHPLTINSSNVHVQISLEITDDLDRDGLQDAWEYQYFGEDFTYTGSYGDPDNDGLSNVEEMNFGTNPRNWDTDGDGMDDEWEWMKGTGPTVSNDLADADGDGLPNILEYRGIDGHGPMVAETLVPVNGTLRGTEDPADTGDDTNPLDVDTDSDGLIDSFESAWFDPDNGIDPNEPGDPTADLDGDGLSNFREQCLQPDLAEGGANDIWSRTVSYRYAIGQPVEAFVTISNLPAIFSPGLALGLGGGTVVSNLVFLRDPAHRWTDPTGGSGFDPAIDQDFAGPDTDGDGLPDGWEVEYGLDPRDPTGDNGQMGDPDGDGLINWTEYLGQDGNRATDLPFVNGTGDETNPNEHYWMLGTMAFGPGMGRPIVNPTNFWTLFDEGVPTTLSGAAPTLSLGADNGQDTDDDGQIDSYEIQNEFFAGGLGSSPVHSMSPFVPRGALITSPAGLEIPDPEGGIGYPGYRPTIHARDWTLECYVKLLNTNLNGALIQFGGPVSNPAYSNRVSCELGLSNNVPYVLFDTINLTNTRYRVDGLVLPTNRWTHLAGVWSHGTNSLALHVDGIFVQEQRIYEEAMSAVLFAMETNPVLAASADGSFSNALILDEVRIWTLARTPNEIEAYRTRLVPPVFTPTNGLAAYFRFDDGGTTAEDFARKAQGGLIGSAPEGFLYGDHGYALRTNSFVFTTNAAPVLGCARTGADDSDGDRLPDDWELINHLDAHSSASPFGAMDDPDGDGLDNLNEFFARTNPHAQDTDQDGIADGNEDLDGDGVVNAAEQLLGSRPDIVDTDDDGYTDGEELAMGTNPANAVDPMTARSMSFGGAAADYIEMPIQASQRLYSWTVEAWVNPDYDVGNSGTILRRTVQAAAPGEYAMTYVLGIDEVAGLLLPYAGFVVPTNSSPALITNFVYGASIPTGTWTHLAASFSITEGAINLYTNGLFSASLTNLVGAPPVNGKGGDTFLRIGENFAGGIDDVRLWSVGRTAGEILGIYDKTVSSDETNLLVHFLRFDDAEATNAVMPWSEYNQPHGIQDFLFPQDWMDQWRHAAIRHGTTTVSTNGAFVPPPSLRVLLEPADARTAGAQWSLDLGLWNNSSAILDNLTPGPHTVLYRTIGGWAAPASETISLANGVATTITRTYVQNAMGVNGTVLNNSSWVNSALPGDGTGTGMVLVAMWPVAGGGPVDVSPTLFSNLTALAAMPLTNGPFAYSMGAALPAGDYIVMAWVDGNNNIVPDLGEPRSGAATITLTQTNSVNLTQFIITDDSDDDGLPDYWEVQWFGDLARSATSQDEDNDGLSNEEELHAGLNPMNFDTDGDGMDDSWEKRSGIQPAVPDGDADPDGDGLLNISEYLGMDGQPRLIQDPLAEVGVAMANPDDTGDALNPMDVDTDSDGLIDSFEAAWYDPANGIEPKKAGDPYGDSDGDGLSNFREQCLHPDLSEFGANDIWSRPVVLVNTATGTFAHVVVTNLPAIFATPLILGATNATIVTNLAALRNHAWTDPTPWTGFDGSIDPNHPGDDTDRDLLPDGWEVEFGLDPRDPFGDNGYWGDPDLDGLINFQEYRGQDGDPATGDETNPNVHFWRTLSSERGPGAGRPIITLDYWGLIDKGVNSVLGSALPGWPLGWDDGQDTDDDGLTDSEEIQQEYYGGTNGTSPVHSMSPFIRRAALITDTNGIPVPDPEGGIYYQGYRPDYHRRDWTIECYVKLLDSGMSGALIRCGGTATGRVAFELGLSNDVPYVMFDTIGVVSPAYRVTGLALVTNRWTHVAGVWDHARNSLGLYIDGIFASEQRVYEESLAGYLFDTLEQPAIGVSTNASFVNALLVDEVRVWGVARTPGEIDAYRTSLLNPTNAHLVAYYRFDDGGLTAEDFARKAQSSLLSPHRPEYLFGDHGFALYTGFAFTNDAAPVLGVSRLGADDSDGDGMPDDWETINHLDPLSAASPNGPTDDPDGDGLDNLNEFYAQTNPHASDTDQDGIADSSEDRDGDGLVNRAEQLLGCRPDIVDTDDDGLTDNEEVANGTNPANSLSPMTQRSVRFGGAPADYLEIPIQAAQRLFSWTIEAWVNPDTDVGNSGTILRRTVQSAAPGEYAMTYVLGMDNSAGLRPYAGFVVPTNSSPSLITNFVYGTAMPTGTWTHLAASFSITESVINLYTNGILSATLTNTVSAPPINGKGGDTFVRIGEDFAGSIDDVRLWSVERTVEEIQTLMAMTVTADETNKLVHFFRFDDGEATNTVMPWSEYHQPQGVQDFLFPQDWKEQWKHAAVRHGVTTIMTNGAFIPPPSFCVFLAPAGALAAGAQWSLDLGPWNNSGIVLDNLATGAHTVVYRAIPGWGAPATETVSLTNGVATAITRTYTQNPLGVNGSVLNDSHWVNSAVPGDGTGTGRVMVAMWLAAGGDPVGLSPLILSNLTALAVMPLPAGPFSYAMGETLPPDNYYVMAWVDANNNLLPDLGEPRSESPTIAVTLTNAVNPNPLTITDDSDNDGLPDYWEVQWFGDLSHSATGQDEDNDGLPNVTELIAGLNPMNFDTDGDGMDDFWEYNHGLDAAVSNAVVDTDGDGLPNLLEYLGMDDQPRMTQDPAAAIGVGRVNPSDHGDSLNPLDIDTDSDGLIDSFEAAWYSTAKGIDPLNAGDLFADPDGDGMANFREQCLHTNLAEAAANDIWSSPVTGLVNYVTVTNLPVIFVPALNLDATNATMAASMAALRSHSWTDPASADSDGDLLPDGWEVEFGLDPRSAVGNNGYAGDPDGDGLINYSEYVGQDGNLNTGDETNPNVHFWRTLSTERGAGAGRPLLLSANYWTWAEEGIASSLGSAPPGLPLGWDAGADTDDDGINDDVEIQQEYYAGVVGSSPVHSMSPFVRRAVLITDPAGIQVPDPEGGIYYTGYRPDYHSRDWTIECYVKPLAGNLSGALIRCGEPALLPSLAGRVSFELGLSNNVPYVRFDTINLTNPTYRVTGLALAPNRWTHVAGVWDHARNTLGLYLDGIFVSEQRVYEEAMSGHLFDLLDKPVLGASVGASFVNNLVLDEVRVWSAARTPEQVEDFRTHLVNPSSADLVAYYRFDDGGLTAEDFARKAQNSLLNATRQEYMFGDQAFALTNGFVFTNDASTGFAVTNAAAPVLGVSELGADDTDGDGLPDDWELINHLDPLSLLPPNGAADDPDGDGLNNRYEFLSQTNPHADDTDQDGILDSMEDLDGDGVVNVVEQDFESRPDMVDTDDDGLADILELMGNTDPAGSASPMISRGVQFGGAAGDYFDVPISISQRLLNWSIDAWVNPLALAPNGGTVLRRTVQALGGGQYAMNYVLGINDALQPYAGFVQVNGLTNFVTSPVALTTNMYTYLAATYDAGTRTLALYTNGALAITQVNPLVDAPPINGKGGDTFVRMGEDLQGELDEVRLWSTILTPTLIASIFDHTAGTFTEGLIHDFRFNDGEATNSLAYPLGLPYHVAQGAQDFVYPTDWEDQWRHAARRVGTVQYVEPGAFIPPPSLTVIIDPLAANTAGAMWNLNDGPWTNSGVILENLIPGAGQIVQFMEVDGWTEPDPVMITLTNGLLHSITRTYTQKATLTINLGPQQARDDGARWRVQESATIWSAWQTSGSTVSNLVAENHTVEYQLLAGWVPPAAPTASEIITLVSGQSYVTNRSYMRPSIVVTIEPPEAVTAGAMWNYDGTTWTNVFSPLGIEVPTGVHTVNFNNVTGWIQPANVTVTLSGSANTYVTGTYYIVSFLGSKGSGLGFLKQPRGIAFNSLRQLYVADSGNHRIQRYDLALKTWTAFGSYGAGAPSGTTTYFDTPAGIAVDANNHLYVADLNNNRIQRRDAGTGAWTVLGGGHGTNVGQFIGPMDVAVDTAGGVYVADHYNHRIQKRTGTTWQPLIGNGTNDGKVYFPRGLMADGTNLLYVTDAGNAPGGQNRAQTFLTNGTFVALLGNYEAANGGLLRPGGMAQSGNTLYLADIDNNRIKTYDIPSAMWTPLALATNYFNKPEDLSPQLRWLFISDTMNNRIVQFVIDYGPSTTWIVPGAPATTVAWDAMPGWRYDLQYTTDLITWFPVIGVTNVPGVNAVITGQDTGPALPPRSYRIVGY